MKKRERTERTSQRSTAFCRWKAGNRERDAWWLESNGCKLQCHVYHYVLTKEGSLGTRQREVSYKAVVVFVSVLFFYSWSFIGLLKLIQTIKTNNDWMAACIHITKQLKCTVWKSHLYAWRRRLRRRLLQDPVCPMAHGASLRVLHWCRFSAYRFALSSVPRSSSSCSIALCQVILGSPRLRFPQSKPICHC